MQFVDQCRRRAGRRRHGASGSPPRGLAGGRRLRPKGDRGGGPRGRRSRSCSTASESPGRRNQAPHHRCPRARCSRSHGRPRRLGRHHVRLRAGRAARHGPLTRAPGAGSVGRRPPVEAARRRGRSRLRPFPAGPPHGSRSGRTRSSTSGRLRRIRDERLTVRAPVPLPVPGTGSEPRLRRRPHTPCRPLGHPTACASPRTGRTTASNTAVGSHAPGWIRTSPRETWSRSIPARLAATLATGNARSSDRSWVCSERIRPRMSRGSSATSSPTESGPPDERAGDDRARALDREDPVDEQPGSGWFGGGHPVEHLIQRRARCRRRRYPSWTPRGRSGASASVVPVRCSRTAFDSRRRRRRRLPGRSS